VEKYERVNDLLCERLDCHTGDGNSNSSRDGAIVYCATRKQTEACAEYLRRQGCRAEAFHAGLTAPRKRRIQEDFTSGVIPVICATNAFGMGIDKDNVRLIIHAHIPGSLENYIQEAGRAGRDDHEADCVLLYDEHDIETQFRFGAMSELSRRDIAQILRGLRRSRQNQDNEVIITAGELLRDEQVDTEFDSHDTQADTKVKTAIAWLERSGFVERNSNRTRVFQGKPVFRSMDEARARMDKLNLPPARRRQWETLIEALINSDPGCVSARLFPTEIR
jgi:ATP-dependent DNA helicase RecQ